MAKLVFVVESPFSERDFNRFGIAAYKAKNIEVVIFDLTNFYNPLFEKERSHERSDFSVQTINSLAELFLRFIEFNPDYVIDLSDPSILTPTIHIWNKDFLFINLHCTHLAVQLRFVPS